MNKRITAIILVIAMLATAAVSGTMALFTDGDRSSGNRVSTGSLDVEMYYADSIGGETVSWTNVETAQTEETAEGEEPVASAPIFSYQNWEPGYTDVKYIKIVNNGDYAFRYGLSIVPTGNVGELAKAIEVYYIAEPQGDITGRDALGEPVCSLYDLMNNTALAYESMGVLLPALGENETAEDGRYYGEIVVAVALRMDIDAGNEYQGASVGDSFALELYATQYTYEEDDFGSDYDAAATFPNLDIWPMTITVPVETAEDGTLAEAVEIRGLMNVGAYVPAEVKLEEGVKELSLTISLLENTTGNVTPGEGEEMRSFDVHIEGVAAENTTPILVDMGAVLPIYMNQGNVAIYHVESGATVAMTEAETLDELDAHNEFYYDLNTGELTVAMATFSEVAAVANTANPWNGEFDYSWYTNANARSASTDYTIVNADQLAAFGAIVGGMDGQTQDSFAGKTVSLAADIDLDDAEGNEGDKIFYPIGYYNSTGNYTKTSGVSVTSSFNSFEGTFDGTGHTIKNFYQNTWEMFGDYNDGYSGTPNHYKDGMGLFGYVYDGTVMNLTVDHFSSDGEFTPTGVIAAFADGDATFENIAITYCNPRVYNTGNGGIIGIAGDTSAANDDHITLKNITVDNSNKISALWGSWDVACGGLVGMYRGNVDGSGNATDDTISFTNCHVAAQIDVYNDVCANYQYYAYRYAGMIIGSVRHNTINAEGKTIPNMTGISASGCTVNYGDWNDYYYCEFEKNTMASYSEDYQFSRVPHSELNFTDSNENGVVDADERASVTGCKHTHTAEENHRAIYLPFHQLFTGYSWGVNSIGLKEYSGIVTDLDITEGDQEESVEKFTVTFTADSSALIADREYKVGDLFAEIENIKPAVNDSAVQVAVTGLDANDPITAVFSPSGTGFWEEGTLTFDKIDGIAIVTIQDYHFCKPTSFVIQDGKRIGSIDKFVIAFDHDAAEEGKQNHVDKYLYRVGNQNTVALSSLFEALDGVKIGNVSVTVETVNGNATGTYTSNDSDWTKGSIQFSGTGIVKVTITDDDYCTPTELMLEVVNATNVTKYSELKNQNSVLLNDITMSANGKYSLYDNKTLYGNGFTFDVTAGLDSDTEGGYVGGNGTVWVRNSTLDNVVIVGEVYTTYGGTVKSEYNFPTVLVLGDSTIANCYISNGCSPVRVGSGCNIEIINSTLEGGIFANLDIRGGTVKLTDVVTINQTDVDGNSISNDKGVVGLGIVVYTGSTVTIDADGLTQHNYVSEKAEFTGEAKTLKDVIFSTDYSQYQFEYNGATWVNTGIVSMVAEVKGDNISEIKGYVGQDASISSYDGYVYAPVYDPSSSISTPSKYSSSAQYAIAPEYEFDYTTKNNVPQVSDDNNYCVYDATTQKYLISFDDGESFVWDADILTVTKDGETIEYTVSVNNEAVVSENNTITFDTAGDYTVTYSYSDIINFRLNDGSIETYTANYEKTVKITVYEVVDTSAKTEFAFGTNGFRAETANNLTYVMPNVNATVDSNTAGIGMTTVGGVNIYYPIVSMHKSGSSSWYNYFSVFEAVTITDLNGTVHSTSSTELPSDLTVIGGFILDANGNVSTAESANGTGIFNYSTGKEIKCTTYSSYGLCYYPDSQFTKTGTSERAEQTIVVKYRYTDSNGTPYYYYVGYWCEEHTKTTCVTPETLITLADGSQKRIDEVTYADELLVWDFYNGEYTAAPASIVMNHGYGNYTVVSLNFADGTTVNTINGHGFYEADSNEFVILSENNAADYVGHAFIKQDGTTTELASYEISEEYTESWSVLTAEHYNCILEDMLTLTPAEVEGSPKYLMPYVMGEGMKYDAEAMAKDNETYGLYTYEDFADYMTYEQFAALNLSNFKVSVGKGYITWDEIMYLISIHIG